MGLVILEKKVKTCKQQRYNFYKMKLDWSKILETI
jgi:hypothetical protein